MAANPPPYDVRFPGQLLVALRTGSRSSSATSAMSMAGLWPRSCAAVTNAAYCSSVNSIVLLIGFLLGIAAETRHSGQTAPEH